MKQIIILFSLVFSMLACKNHAQSVQIISSQQLKQTIDKQEVQLVDVRTEGEFEKGSIGAAVNIDVSNKEVFKKEVQKFNKEEPIYVFCQKGGRSNKATKILEELGFTQIYDYSAGYSEWGKLNN